MKKQQNARAVIFIRTSNETKAEFLRAVEKECSTSNTLGELLIKEGLKNINKTNEQKNITKTN